MELGIYTFAETTPDPRTGRTVTPAERLRDLLEEIALADELGLDVFGVGEHHRPEFAGLRARGRPRRGGRAHEADPPRPARSACSARTTRCASSRTSRRSTCCPAGAPRSWPAAARSSSPSRCSATTSTDYDELFAEKLELLLELREAEHVTWAGRHRAAARRPGRVPAAAAGPAAGVGRRGRHAAVGRARGRARPADGARDHRRPARALRARSPSCTAAPPRRTATRARR